MGSRLKVVLDVKKNQSQIIWTLLERMRPDRSSVMREYHEKLIQILLSDLKEEDKDIFQDKYLPRLDLVTWLNDSLEPISDITTVNEAKQYPYFGFADIMSRFWSIDLGCHAPPNTAIFWAEVNLVLPTDFFWINSLGYRQTCIQLTHEFAEILGSTQALYFDNFGDNYDSISSLYCNNYIFYDYAYDGMPNTTFPYAEYIPFSEFLEQLAKEMGPPLDMDMKYPENELVPIEKAYTAYFVERF